MDGGSLTFNRRSIKRNIEQRLGGKSFECRREPRKGENKRDTPSRANCISKEESEGGEDGKRGDSVKKEKQKEP